MRLTNEWYYYTSAIDKKTCNKIKALAKNDFSAAEIDRNKGTTDVERINGRERDVGLDIENRLSDVSWTSEQWVINLIWPFMAEANEKAGWNFDIRAVESMQITRYGPDGFYGWHVDGCADSLYTYNNPDNKFMHGNARKLSMTILLNDSYQGGEFQFSNYHKLTHSVETPEFNKSGSLIIFPSFMEHQVSPVTKGKRYSLVAWFVGPPFK